jgi:hypothetical protein
LTEDEVAARIRDGNAAEDDEQRDEGDQHRRRRSGHVQLLSLPGVTPLIAFTRKVPRRLDFVRTPRVGIQASLDMATP